MDSRWLAQSRCFRHVSITYAHSRPIRPTCTRLAYSPPRPPRQHQHVPIYFSEHFRHNVRHALPLYKSCRFASATSWPRNKTDRQIRYETSLSCRESQRRCTTDVVVKGVRPSPLRRVTIGARRGSVNFSKPYCFRLYILGDCDWSDDVRVCTGENAHRHPECDDCTLGKTVGF